MSDASKELRGLASLATCGGLDGRRLLEFVELVQRSAGHEPPAVVRCAAREMASSRPRLSPAEVAKELTWMALELEIDEGDGPPAGQLQ